MKTALKSTVSDRVSSFHIWITNQAEVFQIVDFDRVIGLVLILLPPVVCYSAYFRM